MRAVSFNAAGVVVVRDLPDPVPGPGEALVAPRYVGLCGTDLELLEGTMPYFAQGVASYPLQPGHEVAGVVVRSPAGSPAPGTPVLLRPIVGCGTCAACRDGRAPHCAKHRAMGVRLGMPGGAAELMTIPAENLIELPPGLSPRDAVLAEPGVTALNSIEAAGVERGMRALVVGAGTLGAIAAQILRHRGLAVDVLIVDPDRRPLVEALGVRAVERVEPAAYAVAFEFAGSAGAVRAAIEAVAAGGTVALAGVQPGPVDGVDVNAIVLNGITVRGPVATDAFPAMLGYLASGAVAAEPLIEQVYELEDAPAAYARLSDPARARPKLMLRIGDGASAT
jgi:2-desacetyl-2-hydroxyethyl bacteriochlorophyllide A dehydrogenase